MNRKFVYFDRENYGYQEIDKQYLETPEKLVTYFGYIDDRLNDKDELTIYELVPHKVLKKDISYKFNDTFPHE